MKPLSVLLFLIAISSSAQRLESGNKADITGNSQPIFGFRDSAAEAASEVRFLAGPDPKLAEEHLRTLTQAPHMAGTVEDKATADYVALKFRAAGLDTEIVEYKVWTNYPSEISVDITAPAGVEMHGPTREHVDGDPYDGDPRVVMPFSSMSPSGDVEAEVDVYKRQFFILPESHFNGRKGSCPSPSALLCRKPERIRSRMQQN